MRRSPPALEARLLFISAVAVVTLIGLCVMAVGAAAAMTRTPAGSGPSKTVSASTALKAGRGKILYTDSFHTAARWSTSPLEPRGTTFTYTPSGYEIVGTGSFVHTAVPPYLTAIQQVSMSITATQPAGSPANTGFGVVCRRGVGAARVQYEIYVGGSQWVVERRDGAISGAAPFVIKEGSSPTTAGPAPMTIVGMCATLADGVSTRVAIFVNGANVVDLVDTATALSGHGWLTGLVVVSSDKGPNTVTVSRFEERDLAA